MISQLFLPTFISQYTFLNFNNFSIIYSSQWRWSGKRRRRRRSTDILISWIYKLTTQTAPRAPYVCGNTYYFVNSDFSFTYCILRSFILDMEDRWHEKKTGSLKLHRFWKEFFTYVYLLLLSIIVIPASCNGKAFRFGNITAFSFFEESGHFQISVHCLKIPYIWDGMRIH